MKNDIFRLPYKHYDLEDFMRAWRASGGEELTLEEATVKARGLIELFQLLLKYQAASAEPAAASALPVPATAAGN